MEKLCEDLISNYIIQKKGKEKKLNHKAVTMIGSSTGWIKIT